MFRVLRNLIASLVFVTAVAMPSLVLADTPLQEAAKNAAADMKLQRDLTTVSDKATGLFKGVTTACWDGGTCTICDGLVVFINVADGILRLLAIVATIFFVYGAGLMMLSQGNEDYVSRGKAAMKATIVGTIITICAWQIMSIVVFVIANAQVEGSTDQAAFEGAKADKNVAPGKYNPLTSWSTIAGVCIKSQGQN